MNTLLDDFEVAVGRINGLPEPETTADLMMQLTLIAEAIEKCEKLLVYLAASTSGREDLLTYLFEYKQLMKLEREMQGRESAIRAGEKRKEAPEEKPASWWDLLRLHARGKKKKAKK